MQILVLLVATLLVRVGLVCLQIFAHSLAVFIHKREFSSTSKAVAALEGEWPWVHHLLVRINWLGNRAKHAAFLRGPSALLDGRRPQRRRGGRMDVNLLLSGQEGRVVEPFYSHSQVVWLLAQRPIQYVVVHQMPSQEKLLLDELAPGAWSGQPGDASGPDADASVRCDRQQSVPDSSLVLQDGPCWHSEVRIFSGDVLPGDEDRDKGSPPASVIEDTSIPDTQREHAPRDLPTTVLATAKQKVAAYTWKRLTGMATPTVPMGRRAIKGHKPKPKSCKARDSARCKDAESLMLADHNDCSVVGIWRGRRPSPGIVAGFVGIFCMLCLILAPRLASPGAAGHADMKQSRKEFAVWVGSLGLEPRLSPRQVKEAFQVADSDRNGIVTQHEKEAFAENYIQFSDDG